MTLQIKRINLDKWRYLVLKMVCLQTIFVVSVPNGSSWWNFLAPIYQFTKDEHNIKWAEWILTNISKQYSSFKKVLMQLLIFFWRKFVILQ